MMLDNFSVHWRVELRIQEQHRLFKVVFLLAVRGMRNTPRIDVTSRIDVRGGDDKSIRAVRLSPCTGLERDRHRIWPSDSLVL